MRELQQVELGYLRSDIPEFRAGDTVRVHVKVREGEKERIQLFQGAVLARRGGGTRESFTVRKMSGSVAVERIFSAAFAVYRQDRGYEAGESASS